MQATTLVLWLAYRDFIHERRLSLCFVMALIAVLAPLLVLFALKFGLMDTLTQRLVQSPHNREVIAVGSRRYEKSWFERMAKRGDVAFVVPNTRRIAASLSLLRNPDAERYLSAVQMIPTAAGDPLLGGEVAAPMGTDQLVLSSPTAARLAAKIGDRLEARIDRHRQGRDENISWSLDVVGIAPETAVQEEAVFVPLELLETTEDYRDGLAVPALGWEGSAPSGEGPRTYARFRLYASSIYDVARLQQALTEEGIDARTQATEIETMQSLDHNLGRVFWLIAIIGTLGFLASLAANLMANVERKRRELSVVRLIGFSTRSIVLFPVAQAMLISVLGAAGAAAIYFPVATVLNTWFAGSLRSGELICRLLPDHLLAALTGTLVCAIISATWAGLRAARIEPAEGIRDV